jgi:hypothetical protein
MKNKPPPCGLTDVFRNDDGQLQCRVCGKVMDSGYVERVRASGDKWFKKLQEQTR